MAICWPIARWRSACFLVYSSWRSTLVPTLIAEQPDVRTYSEHCEFSAAAQSRRLTFFRLNCAHPSLPQRRNSLEFGNRNCARVSEKATPREVRELSRHHVNRVTMRINREPGSQGPA